jgi:hypothetical protein
VRDLLQVCFEAGISGERGDGGFQEGIERDETEAMSEIVN